MTCCVSGVSSKVSTIYALPSIILISARRFFFKFWSLAPKHDYDRRGLIFIVVKFFLFSGLRGTDMLCMWCQFRGFYRCMVTVVVSMHTPKHSSDPCGSIFIFV